MLTLNAVEKEVVFTKAIVDIIDSMINREMFKLCHKDPESCILIETNTHQKFFGIMLTDMLSTMDDSIIGEKISYIKALEMIIREQHFNANNSIRLLDEATKRFINWLNQDIQEKLCMPSIEKEGMLKLARKDYLWMLGNISKHNALRLGSVAKKFTRILKENDVTIQLDDALLAMADLYNKLHNDLFEYNSSMIAELLNDIRWGIHEYLLPEFKQSFVRDNVDSLKHGYTYPKELMSNFAKTCYWDLMNDIRRKPIIPRFKVTNSLKKYH